MGRKDINKTGRNAEGKQIGVEQINRLNQRLIEQGRFDDLTKAASDKVYQEKLLKEFEI